MPRGFLFFQRVIAMCWGRFNVFSVTRGLDPRVHLLRKNWIVGSSPAMTNL
jgi:hypothetical protein